MDFLSCFPPTHQGPLFIRTLSFLSQRPFPRNVPTTQAALPQQVLGKEQGLSFQLLWVLGSPGPRVTLSKPQVPESLGRGHFYSLAYLGVRVALGLMTSQRAPFLQSCVLYTVNAH